MKPSKCLQRAFFLIPIFFFVGPLPLHSACLKKIKATLRKGPGKNFKKLWEVTLFTPLKVKKYKNQWAEVEDAEGILGWLPKSELTDKYFCGSVKIEKVSIQLLPSRKGRPKKKQKTNKAFAFFDQNFKILDFKKSKVTALSPLGNRILVPRRSLWVQ